LNTLEWAIRFAGQYRLVKRRRSGFRERKKEWNVYKLADGTTLKVKLVLVNVVRSRDKYDPLGNPIYGITSQNIVKVLNAPKKLKREP